jgi:hypothetical protein
MKNEENNGNNAIFECFLLNAIKNEENKLNNAMFLMFLVESNEKKKKIKEIMHFLNVSC